MTTAYSRADLDKMAALFEERLPRLPNEKDLRRLPAVDAMAASGSPIGLLVRLHLEAEEFTLLFFNPVVTSYLFTGINECAMDGGWWKGDVGFVGNSMPLPTGADMGKANEVVSLTTGSAGDVAIVHLVRRGGSKQLLGLRKQTAINLFLTIKQAWEQFGLWDKDLNLLPAEGSQRISEVEVWRAANQLIGQFAGAAYDEAANRSKAAYAKGDMFNTDLWERIARVVAELAQAKPDGPTAVN